MSKVVFIIFALIIFGTAKAQEYRYPEVYDSSLDNSLSILPNNILEVRNYVTPRMTFEMSFNGTEWNTFKIKRTQHLLISLYKFDKGLIRICTSPEKGCVIYKIRGANRYRFYWNKESGMWDLVQS